VNKGAPLIGNPGFGPLLRAHRREFGLTQEELARRCGLSDRAIRDLERGRVRRPRRSTVELLSDALGLGGPEAVRFVDVARGGPD
jgi:transcriptional regulator with XRE-family HTH domain